MFGLQGLSQTQLLQPAQAQQQQLAQYGLLHQMSQAQHTHGTVHQMHTGPTATLLVPATINQAQYAPAGPLFQSIGQPVTPGQETLLPHAFTAGTLHDPTTGAWNMDTDGLLITSRLNKGSSNKNETRIDCIRTPNNICCETQTQITIPNSCCYGNHDLNLD